jgi:hypothetical protein
MIRATSEYRRFLARALKTRYGVVDALDAPPGPLWLQTGPDKPKRLLYIAKSSFQRILSNATSLPDDLAIFWQSTFASRTSCNVLIRYAREVRKPIFFVGDLDPIGLTQFADLRSRGVPIRYLGIDDRWLRLCREYVRPLGTHKGLNSISIPMDDTEREHFTVVTHLVPDLKRLIGPKCFALLQSGRKLELEGAGIPHHFRKPFLPALTRLLLGH